MRAAQNSLYLRNMKEGILRYDQQINTDKQENNQTATRQIRENTNRVHMKEAETIQ